MSDNSAKNGKGKGIVIFIIIIIVAIGIILGPLISRYIKNRIEVSNKANEVFKLLTETNK